MSSFPYFIGIGVCALLGAAMVTWLQTEVWHDLRDKRSTMHGAALPFYLAGWALVLLIVAAVFGMGYEAVNALS